MLVYILIFIYIFLYITHIILGPYWMRFLITNKELEYKAKNLSDIYKRIFYITYLGFLWTIFFLLNPNTETFINALIVNMTALIFFVMNYTNSKYYYGSIVEHSIILLPFIFYKKYFNIKIKYFQLTAISYSTILLGIMYPIYYKNLYDIK